MQFQRILFNHSIEALEKLFEANQSRLDKLKELAIELEFRDSPKARVLRDKVHRALMEKKSGAGTSSMGHADNVIRPEFDVAKGACA